MINLHKYIEKECRFCEIKMEICKIKMDIKGDLLYERVYWECPRCKNRIDSVINY